MEFETVERCGRVHVIKKGVEAAWFIDPSASDDCIIYGPHPVGHAKTLEEAIVLIAEWVGDWYTVAEAADRLVELGAFDKAPATQMISRWARDGRFPGAVKVPTRGAGGSWRIPAAALIAFAEGRKGR